MILALETVFEQCSVALINETLNKKLNEKLNENTTILDEITEFGNRQQTQQILPLIQTIFSNNNISWQDITAIAFNRGPGAFSGIRINAAVAQALSFAHDLPCLPVSSLQAVAQAALVKEGLQHVVAVIDARMNEVYMGEFIANKTNTLMQSFAQTIETLQPYHQLPQASTPIFVGNGAKLLFPPDSSIDNNYHIWENIVPTAAIIGQLGAAMLAKGEAVTAENALPVYLRHNAWKTLAEQGKK